MAPSVSAARWKPNALPRSAGAIDSASMALRSGLRMPRPNQASIRPRSTSGQLAARANSAERTAGQGIAGRGDRLAMAQPVAPPAGPQLDEAGKGVRHALDESQGVDRGADDGQEAGQYGGGHLVAGVAQQARQGHAQHVAVEPAARPRHILVVRRQFILAIRLHCLPFSCRGHLPCFAVAPRPQYTGRGPPFSSRDEP